MPIDKPTIVFDFSLGRVAERLPEAAVVALVENRLPTRKFWHELSAYFRAKPIQEARPRQILNIVDRYVSVQPLRFAEMEKVVGKAARQYLPDVQNGMIPELLWMTQDFMDVLNKRELGDPMRFDIDRCVSARFRADQYYQLIVRYLSLSGVTTKDVRQYAAQHPSIPRQPITTSPRAITAH